jgi:hypothetical protein
MKDQPAAIAIAADGHACATAAIAPALGLRTYRLPGLEPIGQRSEACNDRVDISSDGKLVACVERRADSAAVQTFVRVFTFPALEPVQSFGPLTDSVDALSFAGPTDQLAVVTTLLDRSSGSPSFRTRLELYDARRGALAGEFSRPGRFPYLAFAPHADVFIWAGEEGSEAWSVRSFVKLRRFDATAHTIAVALSPNGRLAAVSQQRRSAEEVQPGGGGQIQIFDTQSGERRAGFGSADLHAAANVDDSVTLPVSQQMRVGFVFLGAAPGRNGRVIVRDWFARPGYIADHSKLAFADDQTLVSSAHGFFAIWTLPKP